MELLNSFILCKFLYNSFKYGQILWLFSRLTSNNISMLTGRNLPLSAYRNLICTLMINLMAVNLGVSYDFPKRGYYLCKNFFKKMLKRIPKQGLQHRCEVTRQT